MHVPDVGDGTGYGAVDKTQTEQVRKTGCVACAKDHKTKIAVGAIILSVIALAISLLAIFKWNHEDSEWQQFQEYQNDFHKSYTTDEIQAKFQAFKGTLAAIRELRALEGKATFGLNEFSDLTPDEFAEEYLGLNADLTAKQNVLRNAADPVLGNSPSVTSLNWTADGAVTPVRNQGSCGSCWAFACVQTIESSYIRKNGMSAANVEDFALSVQQMVSCDSTNYGCSGGWPIDAFKYVQQEGGLTYEEDYPYKGWLASGCKSPDADDLVEGTTPQSIGYGSKCNDYWDCDGMDEDSMAWYLENYGPMVVCVNASPWQYYTGGVLDSKTCNKQYGSGRRVLNHAVMVTGFDLDNKDQYWSVKNSWSTSWGDSGYIHLEFGDNTCGVANDVLYIET